MWRQLSWVGVGLVGLLVVVSVDYRNLVRFAPVFYVVGLGLLLSVFILGRTVSARGAGSTWAPSRCSPRSSSS